MSFNDKSLRPHCRGIPPKQAKQAPFLVVVGGRGWGNCAFPGLIAWLRMLHDAPVLLLFHENITMNLGCYPMIFPLYLVKSIHFLMKSFFDIWILILDRFHPHCWRIFSTLPLGHFHRSQLQNPKWHPLHYTKYWWQRWKSMVHWDPKNAWNLTKSGPKTFAGSVKKTHRTSLGMMRPEPPRKVWFAGMSAYLCDREPGELGAGRLGSFTASKIEGTGHE